MAEPIIEHKYKQPRPKVRQDTTISLLAAKLVKGEQAARALLHQLEDAMVRCGYTRDGVYNSRTAGWSSKQHGRCTVIIWEGGKILLSQGLVKDKGNVKRPFERNRPLTVSAMNAHHLIQVAGNLAPFLDALENNTRFQVEALEAAAETIRALLERVERNPQPSETPAQHDPE